MQVRHYELRYLTNQLKAFNPAIYRETFKRIYGDDQKFHDWRLPLWVMGHSWSKLPDRERGKSLSVPVSFNYQQIALARQFSFPLFFVEPELFEACASSGLPKGLKFSELKMPFPSFTFILPKGAFSTKEGDVHFITVSIDLKGRKTLELGSRGMNVETADDGMLISTFFPKNAGDFCIRITDDIFTLDRPPAFHEHLVADVDTPKSERLFGDDSKTLDEITIKMASLVPALILAMECRPEIVTRERKIKHLRRDRASEVWEPNRIGGRYRIQLSEGTEAGTHSSPKAHIRRGHFRLQPIGPRGVCLCSHKKANHVGEAGTCEFAGCNCYGYEAPFANTKKIWLEPTWVNLGDKNGTENYDRNSA